MQHVTTPYLRGSQGVYLVVDVTDEIEETEAMIQHWIQMVQTNAGPDCKIVIVGNKCDSCDRKLTPAEGLAMAQRHGMRYFEASAKTGVGVEEAFDALIREVVHGIKQRGGGSAGEQAAPASDGGGAPLKKRSCAVA